MIEATHLASASQCNPPERAPREEKERSISELFIRHLLLDVLSKKTLDKTLRLLRKLDWDVPEVGRVKHKLICLLTNKHQVLRLMHKYFTKPWKIKHGHISYIAILAYDLQRYHPDFVIGVVDQVLEDFRRGLESNIYTNNQRRVATIKYIGELYIYRVLGSSIIFDTLWTLATFGHRKTAT
jgi:regulator of nonsense transcripts 2